MAGGLLRVLVLLCAAAAVARAQVWYTHGKPHGTSIKTAMAPLTHSYGTKWFGVGANGRLYERRKVTGNSWQWVYHGLPYSPVASNRRYQTEPCAFEGIDRLHVRTNDFRLYQRYRLSSQSWTTNGHGLPSSSIYVSGCSSVYLSGDIYNMARTFLRGHDGNLWERYSIDAGDPGAGTWSWRNHEKPSSTVSLRYRKTTSYVIPTHSQGTLQYLPLWPAGTSNVFVLGSDGNVWLRKTSEDGFGVWVNLGKPVGSGVSKLHATLNGGLWAVLFNGRVSIRLAWPLGWQQYGLIKRGIRDCSDPFRDNAGRRSVFCITNPLGGYGSSGYGLYKLSLSNSPPDTSPALTWTYYGVPTAPLNYFFIDRPNVAFDASGNVESVFVTSTGGVFELRF